MASLDPSHFFLAAFVLWLVYSIVLAIYRLTLHPLARFPGPKIAAATSLYEFYHDVWLGRGVGGRYFKKIDKMHEQYGAIVRVSPEELHVKDSDYFTVMHAARPARRNKHYTTANVLGRSESTFATHDYDLHKKRRAALSPMFSKYSINKACGLIWEQLEILSKNLEESKACADVVDLYRVTQAFATDTVTKYSFGQSMELQKDLGRSKRWQSAIRTVVELMPLTKRIPEIVFLALHLPKTFVQLVSPRLAQYSAWQMDTFTVTSQFLHQEKASSNRDFKTVFQRIQESSLPEHEKSFQRILDESMTLVSAGSETTASTFTYALYFLVSNPEMMKNVRRDLSTVYHEWHAQPSPSSLRELPYLTAVIKETLRIAPFITSRLPMQAHDDLQYGPWKIPAMTPVSTTIRHVLLDPDIFIDPDKFIPERWLVDGKKNTELDKYFVPFSAGQRMCLGYELAMAELYLGLSMVLRRFELTLYDTEWERDLKIDRDCFMGLPCVESRSVRVKVTGIRD